MLVLYHVQHSSSWQSLASLALPYDLIGLLPAYTVDRRGDACVGCSGAALFVADEWQHTLQTGSGSVHYPTWLKPTSSQDMIYSKLTNVC